MITSFGNIFLPMKGGAGFRAVYLKSRHDFDYSYFVSSLAANYLIVFNISSVAALACLSLFYLDSGGFSLPAALVFIAVAASTSWAIFFPPPSLKWIPSKWVRERANQVLSGWQIIRKSRKTVVKLCYLTALNLFLLSPITWLEFAAFQMKDTYGNGIGFLQSAIFTTIGALSLLISITPAALGIKESLLMFSSQFLGITQSQALAVSLLDRFVNVMVLCLFFGFSSIYINKKLKTKNVSPLTLQP
ncbi:MAG: lysylphosphatidylglycerol synthase domain-containing protein [Syntrophobacteraceae bacterium]